VFRVHAGKVVGGADNTWVEDSLPAGAVSASDGGDSWNWISGVPSIPFGLSAHKNTNYGGVHQHYFYGAAQTLSFSAGESAFTYVWLDPTTPPTEIMIQFHDTSGSWEHRAYWGANQINWGSEGQPARVFKGALPAPGQWVRFDVPAQEVGLVGSTINGMAFSLYGGRATFDYAGKVSQVTFPLTGTVSGMSSFFEQLRPRRAQSETRRQTDPGERSRFIGNLADHTSGCGGKSRSGCTTATDPYLAGSFRARHAYWS
jgi:hypothetical protein